MRMSQFFLPTLKEIPAEAHAISHQLMLRAGMIRQASAGIYSWLPLGFRVLKKIEHIVREEQDKIGAQEILMPTLQSADIWRLSGRYDSYGQEMLRIKDRQGHEMLYGPTNEEQVTEILRDSVKSYRDLPKLLYHMQWKFRDEIRPRFGVMRGREFYMKDAYSFDRDEAASRISYSRMFLSYLRIFKRLGLQAIPMAADSGLIGGDMSHEFIILAETGESTVYCHADALGLSVERDNEGDLANLIEQHTSLYTATDEKHDPQHFAKLPSDKQVTARGIEVGHIFLFGTKYSQPMGALVACPDGRMTPVYMGSYGIGVSRLVGAIIEACHDERGIIWPESVAPFKVGIINLKPGDSLCDAVADKAYACLSHAGYDVLLDDRDDRAGSKFADFDLIGLPWRVTVGPRNAKKEEVDVAQRAIAGDTETVSIHGLAARLDSREFPVQHQLGLAADISQD